MPDLSAPSPGQLTQLWANREELLRLLPPRFAVAFAVRCARRVQPLYDLPSDFAMRRNYTELLDFALKVVEDYARRRLRDEGAELRQAAAAASAAGNPAADAADVAVVDAAVVAARAAAAAAVAHEAAHAAAAAATAVAHEAAVILVFCSDLSRLQSLLSTRNVQPTAPLDPGESGPLGPLWPFGVPEWYATGKKRLRELLSTPPARESTLSEGEKVEGPIWDPSATEKGKQAVLTFRRDLPELLKKYPGKWVAYHGDQRVGIAATGRELYKECERRGIPDSDYIVWPIEPEGPDEVLVY